ncbi:MAG TPA: protein-L-isoaspartate(D-aspartate) O-methyltransferase [Anaerolineales bacterium]|nr:protein-L-isoaspartate(D-aspartate) O-methyltransferase [Anaerolineales bacterium]
MDEEAFYTQERLRMVVEQIQARDIYDERVLEAMRKVPRHRFVPPEHWHLAYADCPLPIGQNQTISQPYIVSLMTELLLLGGNEVILEIGTGSGYQAAILSLLAREVYTIERHQHLATQAAEVLAELGLTNVHVHVGDGSLGWPEHAPYDGVIATAAAPRVPKPLLEQLADGGRLVIPVGGRGGQYLERWLRQGEKFKHEQGVPVAFVPLLGEYGWQETSWEWQ